MPEDLKTNAEKAAEDIVAGVKAESQRIFESAKRLYDAKQEEREAKEDMNKALAKLKEKFNPTSI